MAKKMWSFRTQNFTVIWEIEEDVLDTAYMDEALAEECRENVRRGMWECFMSTVKVIENSTKLALGEAYLGGSIYANPAEFRDHFGMNRKGHGSYFSDMVRKAIADARKAWPAFKTQVEREIHSRQKMLAVNLQPFEVVAA